MGYLCFEEDCDACVAERELLDKGLIQIPSDYPHSSDAYNQSINGQLKKWHLDYWNMREKSLHPYQSIPSQSRLYYWTPLFKLTKNQRASRKKSKAKNSSFISVILIEQMMHGLQKVICLPILQSSIPTCVLHLPMLLWNILGFFTKA